MKGSYERNAFKLNELIHCLNGREKCFGLTFINFTKSNSNLTNCRYAALFFVESNKSVLEFTYEGPVYARVDPCRRFMIFIQYPK